MLQLSSLNNWVSETPKQSFFSRESSKGGLNAKAPNIKGISGTFQFQTLIWGTHNSIAFVVAFISHK